MNELAEYLKERTLKYGNPAAVSPNELSSWARELNLPRGGERIFYAGMSPMAGYMDSILNLVLNLVGKQKLQQLAKIGKIMKKVSLDKMFGKVAVDKKIVEEYFQSTARAAELLLKLGFKIGYLYENEPWCGLELHTYGFLEEFSTHAKEVFRKLKEEGVREIITPDTLSAYAFKYLYPEFIENFDIEVKHLIEVLPEAIEKKTLRMDHRTTVTYHDPCYLARYLRVVDEPRMILSRIENLELKEPEYTSYRTRCDGGGGIEGTYPELADKIAAKRIQELVDTGAEKIITSCPICVMMLRRGLKMVGNNEIEVLELHDLVYKTMV